MRPVRITASAPAASAARMIVPRLPGSRTSSQMASRLGPSARMSFKAVGDWRATATMPWGVTVSAMASSTRPRSCTAGRRPRRRRRHARPCASRARWESRTTRAPSPGPRPGPHARPAGPRGGTGRSPAGGALAQLGHGAHPRRTGVLQHASSVWRERHEPRERGEKRRTGALRRGRPFVEPVITRSWRR